MDYQTTVRAMALALALAAPANLRAAPGDDQYAVAAGHYTRGRWELATDEFRTLLNEYPEHAKAASARFYLGEALVQLGRFDDAHAAFQDFLKHAPDDSRAKQALFRAAETSYLGRQSEAATRELTQFAERYPDDELNAYVIPYLGDLALSAKQWELARRHYQAALEKFPTGPLADDCRYSLARALERLDQRPAAEGLYADLARKKSGEVGVEAQYHLGSAQYARGDYRAAAATLGEFAAAAPKHAWFEQARLAEGWSRYRLKEYEQAAQIFSSLTGSATHSLEAKYWLGLTQKAQGNWAAAAETLKTAADSAGSEPLAAALHFHAGEALLRAGNFKDADVEFARVITSHPDSEWTPGSWLGRTRAAFLTNNHPLVDHHAAHFAEHCRDSDKRWAVDRVLADSYLARKETTRAIELLEMLVSQDPDAVAAASHQLALAVAYLGDNRAEEALSLVENLPAEATPEVQGESQLTRAQALVALQRFADALPVVETRLPHEVSAARLAICRAQLAICLARTGDVARAREVFQQLVADKPDADLLAATTSYLADAARDAGDRAWSDELLASATSQRMPTNYASSALATRGWDEFQAGEYQQAAATLERLLQQFPDHKAAPQAALTRGQALERLAQFDAALAAYEWLLAKHPQSEPAPLALLSCARLQERLDKNAEAAASYERLLRDFPQLTQRDAAIYESAWVLRELNQTDRAAERFEHLRTEFPHSKLTTDATFRLAELATQRQEFDRAAQLLSEIDIDAAEPALRQHILYAQGQLAAKRERWNEVAQPLERLRKDFPQSDLRLLADYWLAEASYRQQQYDQARQQFDLLAEETAGRQENWVALTALRRAQLAARRDEWQLAHELAQAIATTFPEFEQQYEADYVLGRALAGQGEYDGARGAYRRVLRSTTGGKTETAAMAQWMIGETYLHQKEYREALREFLRLEILYAYPTWQAGALLQAGKCQELLGQTEQAAELYLRVVQEFPRTEFATEAGERLKAVGGAPGPTASRPRATRAPRS